MLVNHRPVSSRSMLVPLLVALVLSSCSREAPPSRGSVADVSIAVVEASEGDASVIHETQKLSAAAGLRLVAGDRLETGAGKMRVRLRDDSVLAIGARTRLALDELTVEEEARRGRIDVELGRFWMHVTKWTGKGESRYEVRTPNAVAGVRGTTLWGDTDVDAICALEGTIDVTSRKDSSKEPATLEAGSCVSKLSEGQLAPLSPSSEQIEKFLDEILIRTK